MVTLGFGFKSYVSYKMRLRKQKEVQKENVFYMQLLQQALPLEQQMLQRQEREAEDGKQHMIPRENAVTFLTLSSERNEGKVVLFVFQWLKSSAMQCVMFSFLSFFLFFYFYFL